MKRSFRITAVTIILLLVISLSLNIVFAVSPGAVPGSDQDPIISKSYVDAAVSQLTAAMQKLQEQIDALKSENTQLNTKLTAQEQSNKLLQDQVNALKADMATGASATGGTGKTGTTSTSGAGTKPPASIGKATVNTPIMNIRKEPNTTSAIMGKAANGETLTLVSKSGDWYKVTTAKGITGYVMARLVIIKK